MLRSRRGSRLVALVVSVAVAAGLACSGDGGTEPPPTPTALVRVSGDGQTADAGQPVANPLVVRVNDAQGRGVAGVAVAFSVTQGGGAVGAGSVTTGADGQASTSWTVGTTAGSAQQARAQVSSPALGPINFAATVVAGPAAKLERVSGDGQQSTQNGPLPQPLIVRVLDQYDNVVTGRAVTWTVLTGGGSVNPAASTSQANGEAQTTWTLGPAGPQTAEASATGLLGSPVGFGATALNLALTAVSPDTLVEGQAATLTGDGFDPTPANNIVMVGGVAATVTAATATTLGITVPTYDCQPARDVGVQVTVGGGTTPAITKRVHPAAFTELAVGEQVIIQDPAQFCVQFRPSGGAAAAFLVGVGASAEIPSGVLPFSLAATAGASSAVGFTGIAPRLPAEAAPGAPSPELSRRIARIAGHRLAEKRIRAQDRQLARGLLGAGAVGLASARAGFGAQAVPSVGDTLRFQIPNLDGDPCGTFRSVLTTVRHVGSAGVWVTDNNKPTADSLTDADIAAFSNAFDSDIYSTDTTYFGSPTDLDANQRVFIVLSQEVNRFSGFAAGFVFSGDLTTVCASSDTGEVFYGFVPDPNGTVGEQWTKAEVIDFMPLLVAHEFTHVIQFSRRLFAPGATTFIEDWEAEGQASLAEEVVGHATLGNSVGQNYGASFIFNDPDAQWYNGLFAQLALYFGWNGQSPPAKVANTPETCSLFVLSGDPDPSPCHPAHFYGASFAFERYVSDRFRATYPGGETQLHRDWIGKSVTLGGVPNVEALLGVSFDSLFAQWAATLYVDDRVTGLPPTLSMSSWNLFNIFSAVIPEAQLTPLERGFVAFSDSRIVRGGSTAYTRLSASGARPALAARVRTTTGGILPGTLEPQLWIVRLQ